MSEFENALPKKEQELKDRTDAAIENVGALTDEEMNLVAGGSDGCTSMSKYACSYWQCDTASNFDCEAEYSHQCMSDHD